MYRQIIPVILAALIITGCNQDAPVASQTTSDEKNGSMVKAINWDTVSTTAEYVTIVNIELNYVTLMAGTEEFNTVLKHISRTRDDFDYNLKNRAVVPGFRAHVMLDDMTQIRLPLWTFPLDGDLAFYKSLFTSEHIRVHENYEW